MKTAKPALSSSNARLCASSWLFDYAKLTHPVKNMRAASCVPMAMSAQVRTTNRRFAWMHISPTQKLFFGIAKLRPLHWRIRQIVGFEHSRHNTWLESFTQWPRTVRCYHYSGTTTFTNCTSGTQGANSSDRPSVRTKLMLGREWWVSVNTLCMTWFL